MLLYIVRVIICLCRNSVSSTSKGVSGHEKEQEEEEEEDAVNTTASNFSLVCAKLTGHFKLSVSLSLSLSLSPHSLSLSLFQSPLQLNEAESGKSYTPPVDQSTPTLQR